LRRRLGFAIVAVAVAVAVAPATGCADEEPAASSCVTSIADSCSELYTPTWDDVYTRTIEAKCAQGGSACHGSEPGQGGLVLSDADSAYDALVAGYVTAGDAGCSDLVVRLAADDPTIAMPPGSPLSESERCAVEKWIASGAAR